MIKFKRKTETNSHSSFSHAVEFRKTHNVKMYKRDIASSAIEDIIEKKLAQRKAVYQPVAVQDRGNPCGTIARTSLLDIKGCVVFVFLHDHNLSHLWHHQAVPTLQWFEGHYVLGRIRMDSGLTNPEMMERTSLVLCWL